MKVLLLSEVCPPASYVGAFRVGKVARAFAAAGHCVHILHVEGGPFSPEPGLCITSRKIRPWPGLRQLILRARSLFTGRKRSAISSSGAGSAEPRSEERSALARAVIGLMHLPDDRQGFIPAAVLAALFDRSRQFDLIYSSGPAHSAHVAAGLLRTLLRVPWVAEFRDPWSKNAIRGPAHDSRIVRRLDSMLEMTCLDQADRVVAVSPTTAADFRSRLGPARGRKIIQAVNGIDVIRDVRSDVSSESLRVLYAGALYPPRDPAPLVESIVRVRNLASGRPVEFVFLGKVDFSLEPRLEAALDNLPEGCAVRTYPWMEKSDAENMIRGADLLLLPAQELIAQIPNKLFDYLGSRVPVLAIAERGSDVAHLLETVTGHHVCYTDDLESDIDATVSSALRDAERRPLAGNGEMLQLFHAPRQMRELIEQVSVAGQRPGIAPATGPGEDDHTADVVPSDRS